MINSDKSVVLAMAKKCHVSAGKNEFLMILTIHFQNAPTPTVYSQHVGLKTVRFVAKKSSGKSGHKGVHKG